MINGNQTEMKQKKLKIKDEGKEHKERIVRWLFYENSTILLNSNLFMSDQAVWKLKPTVPQWQQNIAKNIGSQQHWNTTEKIFCKTL